MNPHDDAPRDRQDNDPREAELQGLFVARGRRDEASAPGYTSVIRSSARAARPDRAERSERAARAAGAARRRGWLAPAPFAAACALLALIALAILWRIHFGGAPARPLPSQNQPTLATWKAPTDFLLAVPGRALLNTTPAFPDPNLPGRPSGG